MITLSKGRNDGKCSPRMLITKGQDENYNNWKQTHGILLLEMIVI